MDIHFHSGNNSCLFDTAFGCEAYSPVVELADSSCSFDKVIQQQMVDFVGIAAVEETAADTDVAGVDGISEELAAEPERLYS